MTRLPTRTVCAGRATAQRASHATVARMVLVSIVEVASVACSQEERYALGAGATSGAAGGATPCPLWSTNPARPCCLCGISPLCVMLAALYLAGKVEEERIEVWGGGSWRSARANSLTRSCSPSARCACSRPCASSCSRDRPCERDSHARGGWAVSHVGSALPGVNVNDH